MKPGELFTARSFFAGTTTRTVNTRRPIEVRQTFVLISPNQLARACKATVESVCINVYTNAIYEQHALKSLRTRQTQTFVDQFTKQNNGTITHKVTIDVQTKLIYNRYKDIHIYTCIFVYSFLC